MKNLIVILFFIPLFGNAQKTHTVAAKETLYSLGRQYNIHPRELAAYNNIPLETGLTIGQVLKIPAKAAIPPVSTSPTPAPVKTITTTKPIQATPGVGMAAVYHKVEKKETLYHISKLYNKVTIEDIRKWNNLSGDGLTEGMNLIVGYQTVNKSPVVSEVVVTKKEKVETPLKPVVTETKPPVTQPVEIVKTAPVKTEANKITGKNFDGGFFKTQYISQTDSKKDPVEESGMAGTFKSTSGWEDGKYYCLYNKAPAGTIVKITHKGSQRSVYAKVLDLVPDLNQNVGILVRLSNAAADELGAGADKFDAVINF
jgi:LysM repeat protein